MRGKVVVCELSGGYDSSLVTLRAVREYDSVHAVFVNCGQKYAEMEEESAFYVDDNFLRHGADRLHVRKVELFHDHNIPNATPGYVPMRNLAIGSLMANIAESVGAREILVGNRLGTGEDEFRFPDTGPEFFAKLSEIVKFISYLPEQAPVFVQTLKGMSKVDVVKELLSLGVELQRLWNCYEGGPRPCMRCYHCTEMVGVLKTLGVYETYSWWWGGSLTK